jgi:hypothetical protein
MIRALFLGFALGGLASSASAMVPLNQGKAFPTFEVIEQVKIVCEADGFCHQPRGRRPLPRWIYGEGAFSGPGPFTGPGNYGWPGSHSIWWPFGF